MFEDGDKVPQMPSLEDRLKMIKNKQTKKLNAYKNIASSKTFV